MRAQRAVNLFPGMFEHRSQKLASSVVYKKRLLTYSGISAGMLAFSLIIGMFGYKWIIGVAGWDDAFYNASMILTGMGPALDASVVLHTDGKIFSGIYAIYSGVIFLTSVAIFFSPVVHRFFHILHLDIVDKDNK